MSDWDAKKQWENLLIESRLRQILSEEKVKTWNDFRKVLAVAIKADELEKMANGGEAVGKVAKNLLGMMFPIGMVKSGMELGGQMKDAFDVVKGAASLKDSQAEKSPLFSYFNIDDGYSEIVDDRLESEFLQWLPSHISNRVGTIEPDEDNVNKMFETFLEERGEFDETVTGASTMAKFTDLEIPEDSEKMNKMMKKIGSAAKGFFSGLF